jgi:hypothetical protein
MQGSTLKTVGAAWQHHRAATLRGEQGLQIVAKLQGCKRLEDCRPRAKDGGGQEGGACELFCCVLNALVACMSLMMREGHVGEEAAIGYYLIKLLGEPYTLQSPRRYRGNVWDDSRWIHGG